MMFSIRPPPRETIDRFLARQSALDVTYSEVGATAGSLPSGYDTDHIHVELGRGEAVYHAAVGAMRHWVPFETSWTRAARPSTELKPHETVAVVARVGGLWSMNACRILDVFEEDTDLTRFGFAFGTLPGHAESGEERFWIEWDRSNDVVTYEIVAFFRPRHPLARVGWFYGRRLVDQFRRDSARTMQRTVQPS